jgi:hypothetical protein
MIAPTRPRRKWAKTFQDAEKRRSGGFTARAGTVTAGGDVAGGVPI